MCLAETEPAPELATDAGQNSEPRNQRLDRVVSLCFRLRAPIRREIHRVSLGSWKQRGGTALMRIAQCRRSRRARPFPVRAELQRRPKRHKGWVEDSAEESPQMPCRLRIAWPRVMAAKTIWPASGVHTTCLLSVLVSLSREAASRHRDRSGRSLLLLSRSGDSAFRLSADRLNSIRSSGIPQQWTTWYWKAAENAPLADC